MIIYPFKEEAFVTKALSEKRISLDYLDIARRQLFDDFHSYAKPIIFFSADDFLILISDDVETELHEKRLIDLHRVSQFGWYYDKHHRVNSQIFASTDSAKINNLLQLNPELRIDSFDKFRDDFQVRKTLNVLSGALALCYHCFRSDYDEFFSKLSLDKSSLKVPRYALDPKNDYVILLQLVLIHNPNDSRINRTLFPQEKALQLLHDFLSVSFKYFYANSYSMSDFLSFLSIEFSQNSEYSSVVKSFTDLNELYVKKGLPVTAPNKLIGATKEFLDIAKTDSDKLRSFLEGDHSLSKTAIFLLGMLHLGDRLEEQFAFDNFVPSLVDMAVRHIKDIKITPDQIDFEIDPGLGGRNTQLNYVSDYLAELRCARELISDINKIKPTNLVFKDFLSTDSAITSLQNDLQVRKDDKTKLESERDTLQADIANLKNRIETLQSDQTQRQAFHKDLLKENESLTSELGRIQAENNRLKNEVDASQPGQPPDTDKKSRRKATKPKTGTGQRKKAKKDTSELFSDQGKPSLTSTTDPDSVDNISSKEKSSDGPHGGA